MTANHGLTRLDKFSNPFDFATAITPNNGSKIAVMEKNIIVENIDSPAIFPVIGGKIKFPEPKNREKSIKLTIRNCLVVSLFIYKVFWFKIELDKFAKL